MDSTVLLRSSVHWKCDSIDFNVFVDVGIKLKW